MQVTVELIKAYAMSAPGDRLTVAKPIADLLIDRGRAKLVEIPPAKPQIKLQPHVKKPNG